MVVSIETIDHATARMSIDSSPRSARHLSRIGGGLLYAPTSNVPWATLLARTFEVDVKSCARCGGRLDVRAIVTDHDIARKILDAIPSAARAPPTSTELHVVYEPEFA
jgi:hypothetical protein